MRFLSHLHGAWENSGPDSEEFFPVYLIREVGWVFVAGDQERWFMGLWSGYSWSAYSGLC